MKIGLNSDIKLFIYMPKGTLSAEKRGCSHSSLGQCVPRSQSVDFIFPQSPEQAAGSAPLLLLPSHVGHSSSDICLQVCITVKECTFWWEGGDSTQGRAVKGKQEGRAKVAVLKQIFETFLKICRIIILI